MRIGKLVGNRIRFKTRNLVNDISFLLVKGLKKRLDLSIKISTIPKNCLIPKKQNNLRKGMRREKNNESREEEIDWKSTFRLNSRQEVLDLDIFHERYLGFDSKEENKKEKFRKRNQICTFSIHFPFVSHSIVQKIQQGII